LDLSQSMLVFSYNNPDDVNPILMDRLNVVKFKAPSIDEKIEIAHRHLVPKALDACALKSDDVEFTSQILEYIIKTYTDETGVRELERIVVRIISTLSVVMRAPNTLTTIDTNRVTKPLSASVIDTVMTQESRNAPTSNIFSMYT